MVTSHIVDEGLLDARWKIGELVYNELYYYLLLYRSQDMYAHIMVNEPSVHSCYDKEMLRMILRW